MQFNRRAWDIDTEYGVERHPGDIATAIEGKGGINREQAGAHAGPVGSAEGPEAPGFGRKEI